MKDLQSHSENWPRFHSAPICGFLKPPAHGLLFKLYHRNTHFELGVNLNKQTNKYFYFVIIVNKICDSCERNLWLSLWKLTSFPFSANLWFFKTTCPSCYRSTIFSAPQLYSFATNVTADTLHSDTLESGIIFAAADS